MMEILDLLLSIVALTLLEIVLGIDNLVFLSILSEKLPHPQRKRARRWGLTFAWVARVLLLASAVWLGRLTKPFITIDGLAFSLRDVFLLAGGMFLMAKATQEIHDEIKTVSGQQRQKIPKKMAALRRVVLQITLMDIVFSLDSVLTAVGLTSKFWVMVLAITIAILFMLYASEPTSRLIAQQPTLKILALCFLMLIGVMLVADGLALHIPRGYLYFAMAFALGVECLNVLRQKRHK